MGLNLQDEDAGAIDCAPTTKLYASSNIVHCASYIVHCALCIGCVFPSLKFVNIKAIC